MDPQTHSTIRQQLVERRGRLQEWIAGGMDRPQIARLLEEVDDALDRMERGTYGVCVACGEAVEERRLLVDPLLRNCLDHLTTEQQRALEHDLDLAWRLQQELLPRRDITLAGWEIDYHYEAVGPVSGDYCEVMPLADGGMFFSVGDVSGKGIAASMLMSQLHAIFRSLGNLGLSLEDMMSRANRLLCESSMPSFYATLACGRAGESGEVEMCNAGHLPSLWVQGHQVKRIEGGGLPLGLFCSGKYRVDRIRLNPGDSLILYSDGLSEATNPQLEEYGLDRLSSLLVNLRSEPPRALIEACLTDLRQFLGDVPKNDDLTVLAIRRQNRSAG
ncbi:MAG: SpoIIE family protein phosphatase [Acidobacteria bacterium]|nr:SpoIIE family protein phosphatase [Acidobacteriota bacterium]